MGKDNSLDSLRDRIKNSTKSRSGLTVWKAPQSTSTEQTSTQRTDPIRDRIKNSTMKSDTTKLKVSDSLGTFDIGPKLVYAPEDQKAASQSTPLNLQYKLLGIGGELDRGEREVQQAVDRFNADNSEENRQTVENLLATYQTNLDAYKSTVDEYNHYYSLDGYKERAEAQDKEVKALTEERDKLKMYLDGVQSGTWVPDQAFLDRVSGGKPLDEALAEVQNRLDTATEKSNKDSEAYVLESAKAEYDRLNNSTDALRLYRTIQTTTSPENAVRRMIAILDSGGEPEDDPSALAQIKKQLGLSPENSGGTAQYMNDLRDALPKAEQEANLSEAALEKFSELGFDYDQIRWYEQYKSQEQTYWDNIAKWEAYAKGHPVAASAVSVLAAPVQGAEFLDQVLRGVGHSDPGNLDTFRPASAGGMSVTTFVNTVRGTVSKELEEKYDWELWGQNVASFLYNTGMSMADSAFQITTLGPAATIFMGGAAAASTAQSVIERGGSNRQAFSAGLAAGVAEAFFEKFSVDRLRVPKTPQGVKGWIKEAMAQGGVEASEEMLTEVSNIISDALILGELSENKGKSLAELIAQIGWAGAGGFLSGATMTTGRNAPRAAIQQVQVWAHDNMAGRQLKQASVNFSMVEQALSYAEDSETYRMASDMAQRLNASTAEGADSILRAVTDAEYGRLARSMTAELETKGPAGVQNQVEAAQAARPEEKVASPTMQAFLEAGDTAADAEVKAGVLDRILSGDTTLTNTQLRKLKLNTQASRMVFEKLTGVSVPKSADTKTLIATARSAAEQAVARKASAVSAAAQTENPVQTEGAAVSSDSAAAAWHGAPNSEQSQESFMARLEQEAAMAAQEAETKSSPDAEPAAAFMPEGSAQSSASLLGQLEQEAAEAARDAEVKSARASDPAAAFIPEGVTGREDRSDMRRARVVPQEQVQGKRGKSRGRRYAATESRTQSDTVSQVMESTTERKPTQEQEWTAKYATAMLEGTSVKNVRVAFEGFSGQENAYYQDGEIVLNGNRLTTQRAINYILGHELTHPGADADAGLVQSILDLGDRLYGEGVMSTRLSMTRERYIRSYMRNHGMSRTQAEAKVTLKLAKEETAADLMSELFETPGALERMGRESTGAKVLRAARDALNRMLSKLTGRDSQSARNEAEMLLDRLNRALRSQESRGTMEADSTRRSAIEDLTPEEKGALLEYKSSGSYKINAALRDGAVLSEEQKQMVESLDRALEKLPQHEGTVYRRLSFDLEGPEALDAFLLEHTVEEIIQYPAYTSTSTDPEGYPVDDELKVTLVIEGLTGHDMEGIGDNFESEVLFQRDSRFRISRAETDIDGKPIIYMKEVTEDGIKRSGGWIYSEERSQTVQPMQEEKYDEAIHLRGISGLDTGRDADGRLPGLRAGRAEGKETRSTEGRGQENGGRNGRTRRGEETEAAGAGQHGELTEADIRYSISSEQPFSEQVDRALTEDLAENWNRALYIRETPITLRGIGLGDLPMTITAKHIQNINHAEDPSGQHPEWHGIDQATIARLPQLLERPVVIMDSATVPGDIVVVASEVDDQGRPIVVSIRPNGTAKVDEQRGPSNFITSVYGRNGYAAWVNQAVRDGRVLYWNKNRSQNLSGKARVQFPAGLTGLASNTIIKRHAGYVKDNIPERRFSVTMDSEGQWLSDEQKEFFKDSKAVDEDGNLLLMYHGTNAGKNFTRFDTYGGHFGLFGLGSYFTDNRSVADSYTAKGRGTNPRVYEVYLNIKNPLDMDAPFRPEEWSDVDPDILDYFRDARTNEDMFRGLKEYCQDEMMYRDEAEEFITDFIIERGYDGITHIGGGRYGSKDGPRHRVFIAFEPEQIKSANNRTPTDDPDIRYSVSDEDINPDTGYRRGSIEDSFMRIVNAGDEQRALDMLQSMLERMAAFEATRAERSNPADAFMPKPELTDDLVAKNRAAIQSLIDKYGRMEQTRTAARKVDFPNQIDDGTKVRGVIRTAASAEATPEALVSEFERSILDGDAGYTYVPISDKSVLDKIKGRIERRGFAAELREWRNKIDSNQRLDKEDIARGEQLYVEACANKDLETAQRLVAELAMVGTQYGQVIQAISMLHKLSPTGQLYYLQKTAEHMTREYDKLGKDIDVLIDPELAKQLLEAGTKEEIDVAMDQIIADIARQLPVTIWDKWDAWRYLAMLGNPTTHIRNMLSNAVFTPVRMTKDLVGIALETAFIRDRSQRTKGVATREARAFAKADALVMKDILRTGGKHNITDRIRDAKQIFKPLWTPLVFKEGFREWARTKNTAALEAEDWVFMQRAYVDALSGFLSARRADLSTLQGEGETREGRRLLNEARAYAVREAQKATYRDMNTMASILNQFRRSKSAFVRFAFGGLLPYTKTPFNIMRRGVEYSPLGLAGAISTAVKGGSSAEILDRLSASFTGTGLLVAGYFLAKAGLLIGGMGDDPEDEFQKLQGIQPYSFQIGDHNYTIDWLAPTVLPLFVGAELHRMTNGDSEAENAYEAMMTILEPVMALSMMSSLNDTLEAVRYEKKNEMMVAMLRNMVGSYFTQGVPTILGRVARTMDDSRRTSFVSAGATSTEKWLSKTFQSSVLSKIPVASQNRMLYIDAWGRADTEENAGFRVLTNFLSPGYYNNVQTTAVDEELMRLAEATNSTAVFPKRAEKSFKVDKETYAMTQEEYQEHLIERGQTSYQLVSDLISSPIYAGMSDEEKAKAVEKCYDYAAQMANLHTNSNYGVDPWVVKLEQMTGEGLDADDYFTVYAMTQEKGQNMKEVISSTNRYDGTTAAMLMAMDFDADDFTDPYASRYEYKLTDSQRETYRGLFVDRLSSELSYLMSDDWYLDASAEERLEMLDETWSDVKDEVKRDMADWLWDHGIESTEKE